MSIASLPDEHIVYVPGIGEVTVGEIRGERVRYVTTKEAARIFSYSRKQWARWAPSIPGAFKDRIWRLPLAACEEHIQRLSAYRRRRRAPWKSTPASSVRARPPHLEAR